MDVHSPWSGHSGCQLGHASEISARMILENAENILEYKEGNKNHPEPLSTDNDYSQILSFFVFVFNLFQIIHHKGLSTIIEVQFPIKRCSEEKQCVPRLICKSIHLPGPERISSKNIQSESF